MLWLTDDAYIPVDDRGLNYGDGLFESMCTRDNRIPLLDRHMQRLADSMARLGLDGIALDEVRRRLQRTVSQHPHAEGWLKLVATRGSSGRGYAIPEQTVPRLIVRTGAMPPADKTLRLRICSTTLPHDPLLAGLKHLNRLPQVLAAEELGDETGVEGLMCDLHGNVVCGIMHNVFIVKDNRLLTSPIDGCGVAGVMRGWVIDHSTSGDVQIAPLVPEQLASADEIIVTNAVRGIRSASHFADQPLPQHTPVADSLRALLLARLAL